MAPLDKLSVLLVVTFSALSVRCYRTNASRKPSSSTRMIAKRSSRSVSEADAVQRMQGRHEHAEFYLLDFFFMSSEIGA